MKTLIISSEVLEKLQDKHGVSLREVEQCFENMCGTYLEDTRENNKTDPATLWFIAPTNYDTLLKVVFIFKDGNCHVKSCFPPNAEEIRIYDLYGK